jgi:hypothetical protein
MSDLVPPQKSENPLNRLEWMATLLGVGAAVVLFASTLTGSELLHIGLGRAGILRLLGFAWMCGCIVLLSLRRRERAGVDIDGDRRLVPFILVAVVIATLLAIAGIIFDL